jgi:sulfur-carrier protein adenylyltransferase/sulfurtransferase
MEEKSLEPSVSGANPGVCELAPTEVIEMHRRGEDVVYLDVREPQEWNLFRIPGAVHVPLAAVSERVGDVVPRDRRVVVYCARGGRSIKAADVLQAMGYASVATISGGIMGWVNAGGELEE